MSTKSKRKFDIGKLNMLIAQTHRLSSRVIGMQLTGGNFIAITLSATQMSCGFLIIGQPLIHGVWYMSVLIALIGVSLAILIERLSLGGLSAVRVAKERLKRFEDGFYSMLSAEKREPEEREKNDLKRVQKHALVEKRTGWAFGLVGMVLSASIGDVFWSHLFEGLGTQGLILSVACALVIGLTFIHSELYKTLMDSVLVEIIRDMHLMQVAVASEERTMQLDMMVDAYGNVRNNKDVRKPAEERIEKTLTRRLTAFASQVESVAGEVGYSGSTVIEGSVTHVPQLPAPRGKYPQHKAELMRLLRGNPQMSQRKIAEHFGISNSTAKEWIDNLRAGK